MKLSIIIPYYNGGAYTEELLNRLAPQITSDVEVILVDDGSSIPFKTDFKWCRVIRKKNGGCASARNRGIKWAKGDYIAFIDADDMVPEYFVEKLIEKTKGDYDVIDFSWKSLTSYGNQHNYILRSDNDRLPNPSVCTRAFKKTYIGDVRFNEKKDSTEDEDFSRRLGYILKDADIKHGSIPEYMYFYRTAVDNSKVKRFKKGLMNTKRIVYHYEHVTSDMGWLLDEIKRENERNEVWLLTKQCDIPELYRYCQIHKPMNMWAHYVRGESTDMVSVIDPPKTIQVVMYIEYANKVGGITTFIYNWSRYMSKYYDILVLYGDLDPLQLERLSRIVKVKKNEEYDPIVCDTLILNRLTDEVPANITYKRTIQICHACVQKNYHIPQDRDILINVSQAAKDSWGKQAEKGIVIHNLAYVEHKPSLFLVSATRCGAFDKGSNDTRMKMLAEKLEMAGIRYIWLNFSDKSLKNMPESFVNMPASVNICAFIEKADYLVQLSDAEAYCMSILEALNLNTAVIATPFPSLYEEGFEDGVNGYTVPFDMDFDVEKLLNVPKFEFEYDNGAIIKQWRKILGTKVPNRPVSKAQISKTTEKALEMIICTKKYYDRELGRYVKPGDVIHVPGERADKICMMGYAKRGII